MVQQQYLAQLHDNFVEYIRQLISFVDGYMLLPQATEDNKTELEKVRAILTGKDVEEIENNLADGSKSGVLKKSTIDKIVKLYKDLMDFALEHISTNQLWKEFLKLLSKIQREEAKDATITRLNELQIPLI